MLSGFFNRRCCPLLLKLLFATWAASACTFVSLFVQLPSLCLGICFSFVVCLTKSLPYVQLLCVSQFQQCPFPPGLTPRRQHFALKMGKFPGVGTHKLSKCPRLRTKKDEKCPVPEIVDIQHFCGFFINQ